MAQAKKQKRSETKEKIKTKNDYLLSGLIFCGKCGFSYVGHTSIKKKNGKEYKTGYYSCSHREKIHNCDSPNLKQNELESYIINLITKKLLDTNEVKEMLININKDYKKVHNTYIKESDNYKKELIKVEKEINNIVDAVAKGIASETLLHRLEDLEIIKKELLSEINSKKTVVEHNEISIDLIKYILDKDIKNIKSKQELKEVIHKWIKKIEVYEEYIIIYFTFDNLPTKMSFEDFFQKRGERVLATKNH